MNNDQLSQLATFYRDGLLNDVLPFWLNHAVDKKHGGIMTSLDRDGTVVDTDKAVWQQGRFTWLLGKLINHPRLQEHQDREHWMETAQLNLEFINRYCFDPDDGRMWFQMTREGEPIRKRRYTLGESFAAIAFGEIAKATGIEEYARQAESCFEQFVQHNMFPEVATSKFTDTRTTKSIGFPMISINTAAELRSSIGLKVADEWIDRCIQEIRDDFCRPEIECVMELVSGKGELVNHFDGRTLNPGHAIEGAWFILSESMHRGNDPQLTGLGCQMLDWMWQRGWDPEFGGLLYFTSVDERPIQEYWQDMKFWWPHNEVIIATLMAWRLTGEEKYLEWHRLAHDWAFAHFPDAEHGEWYGYLRRDGYVTTTLKGNLWKGPFHLPRMQLKCWDLLQDSLDSC